MYLDPAHSPPASRTRYKTALAPHDRPGPASGVAPLPDDLWLKIMRGLDGATLLACRGVDVNLKRLGRDASLPGHQVSLRLALERPLRVGSLSRSAVDFVADILAHMPSLRLGGGQTGATARRADRQLFALVAVHMQRATRLEVLALNLSPLAVSRLSHRSQQAPLLQLTFDGCQLYRAGIRKLLDNPALVQLRGLNLSGNKMGDLGAKDIAAATQLSVLLALSIDENGITSDGLDAVAEAPHLRTLSHLSVADNPIDGVRGLMVATQFGDLQTLNLAATDIKAIDLDELLRAPFIANLATLILNGIELGSEGGEDIARAPQLEALAWLHMNNAQLGPFGVSTLSNCSHLSTLISLSLASNSMGDDGAFALGESDVLRGLEDLDVQDNAISLHGGGCLAMGLFIGPQLTRLALGGNAITRPDFFAAVTSSELDSEAVSF